MASLSPSLHASRPGVSIDPHRQAEYPVLLGESLRDNPGAKAQFFSLQYNWKPKNISTKQRTVITKADGQSSGDTPYLLTIHEPAAEGKPYKYAGKVNKASEQNGSSTSSPGDPTTSLALVFNEEKSAFILEKISAALDFNLTSAPGQLRADIQAYPQLTSGNKSEECTGNLRKPTSSSSNDDDDEPDTANPYDYRHFLEEAKANAEKGFGNRTPIPGGLSGLPSPVPTASRFRASSGPGTPLHKPITSTPSTQMKKRKISDERAQDSLTGASTATHKTTALKPKPKSTSSTSSKPKPLSKERISDSDEEIGDTITLSRPPPGGNARKQNNKPPAATARAGYGPSPRIEVDEAADLVIDMGSPPPPVARRRPPGIDSPFAIARTINPGTSLLDSPEELEEDDDDDEEEQDAEGEPDDDLVVMDMDVDAGVPMRDVDSDVEDLVLGSPAASTTRAASVSVGMRRVDVDADADEDEDDELAAELEAALENDDEDGEQGGGAGNGGGVGLGISTGTGGGGGGAGGEDESEISEEE
jgi:hypothetical protein